jgi:hypothetical protein
MIDEDVRALWEPWMVQADRLLDDEELIDRVYFAQGERREHSATRGRSQTPAEMVLRLMLLKHVRNWSFDVLEREVRMNLAHCDFTRIGMGKVPDAKTLARIAQALGGEVIAELHRRLVEIAQEEGVIQGVQAPSRHDGSGNQHSLPDRFELVGRWCARADAHDEEDRNRGWQPEAQSAQPHAEYRQAGGCDCDGEPPQGRGRRSAAQEAIQRAASLLAADSQ